MKLIFPVVGFVALSACATPATPPAPILDGAPIPFSQVLAENVDRPFECLGYDARTDTCEEVSTFEALGNGQYIATSTTLFGPSFPPIIITTKLSENGDMVCFDISEISFSVKGESDLSTELALASIENEFKNFGETCGVYVASETGYTAQIVRGPDFALADPPVELRFFAREKGLRFEEP